MNLTPAPCADLERMWAETNDLIDEAIKKKEQKKPRPDMLEPQFLVLIPCRDEKHQVELLDRFQREGLGCKAVVG